MSVQLILKNSSVEDRHPTDNQLTNGEISLNYNAAGAFLSCRDTNGDIQHLGGVKIDDATPGSPSKQALWFQPSTGKLFVYDGTGWLVVASGGSGPGSDTVDQILAGNGINSDPASGLGTITLDADIDTSKGLRFLSGKIALAIGEGLEFDPATGDVKATASATSYKGEVNLTTNAAKPTGVSAGDTFYNGGTGTSNAVWNPSPATGTSVTAGDLVVYNGTGWDYIPSGAAYPNPALWSRTSGVLSPATSSDDVEIGGGNISLKSNGSVNIDGRFTAAGNVAIGTTSPQKPLVIVTPAGTDCAITLNEGTTSNPLLITQTATESKIQNNAAQPLVLATQSSSSSQYIAFETNGIQRAAFTGDGNLVIGGTIPSAPNITLARGGTITAGGNASGGGATGTKLSTSGFINVARASGSTIASFTTGSSNATFKVDATGLTQIRRDVAGGLGGELRLLNYAENSPNSTVALKLQPNINSQRWASIEGHQDSAGQTRVNLLFKTPYGAIATERMRVSSIGYVGIGTQDPVSTLHVTRANNKETARFQRTGAGDRCGIYFATDSTTSAVSIGSKSDAFTVELADDEKFRVSSDGKVGIGTEDPQAPLQVGDGTESITLSGADLKFNRDVSYIQHTGSTTLRIRDKDQNNYMVFKYNSGAPTISVTRQAEFSNDVLIGGTLPSAPAITLASDGDITAGGNLLLERGTGNSCTISTTVANGNDSHFSFKKSRGVSGNVQDADSIGTIDFSGYYGSNYQTESLITCKAVIGASYSDKLQYFSNRHDFVTSNNTRMTIDSAGVVNIGGTLPSAPNSFINPLGTALFKSNCFVGEGNPVDGQVTGCGMSSQGRMIVSRPSGNTFESHITGTSTPTFKVGSGGAVTASSTITSGGNPINGTNSGTRLGANGYLAVSGVTGNGAITSYLTGTSTPTFEVTADGDVTSAGTITSGGNPSGGANTGARVTSLGIVVVSKDSGTTIQSFTTGDSSPTFRVDATGRIVTEDDIVCSDNSKGLVLKSPNGTSFRLSVANNGTLSAAAV
jgi:hypothetical protein